MANKTLPARFPVRKLHQKGAYKKMQSPSKLFNVVGQGLTRGSLPTGRQAGRGEKGISRRPS